MFFLILLRIDKFRRCWQEDEIYDTIMPVAPHCCPAVNRRNKNEKFLGLPISSIVYTTMLALEWVSTILNTVLNGKSIWFLPVQYGVVSIVEVSLFFSFALSLGACKNLKNKIKKAKGAWQNERFCDIFFFACCDAKAKRSRANRSLKLKGRERRKSQRAKIFGKENKRRTKNGRRRVFRVMNNYSNAVISFSLEGQRS